MPRDDKGRWYPSAHAGIPIGEVVGVCAGYTLKPCGEPLRLWGSHPAQYVICVHGCGYIGRAA